MPEKMNFNDTAFVKIPVKFHFLSLKFIFTGLHKKFSLILLQIANRELKQRRFLSDARQPEVRYFPS